MNTLSIDTLRVLGVNAGVSNVTIQNTEHNNWEQNADTNVNIELVVIVYPSSIYKELINSKTLLIRTLENSPVKRVVRSSELSGRNSNIALHYIAYHINQNFDFVQSKYQI